MTTPEALALLDVVPCGILQTAADGTIRRANQLVCQWVGLTADEMIGRARFQDFLTVGGRIFHHTHWAPLLQMQGSISEVKLQIVHRDGTTLPLVFNARLRDLGDGEIVHEIAGYVARDRDRYERELVQSRRRLEEAIAELDLLHAAAKDRALFAEQMIGIVSHDLRNPLSAIAMGCTLLSSSTLPPSDQRIIERIERSTDRANRLIADLLDFTQARLGSGLSIAPSLLDLHDLVGETLEELRLAYAGHTIAHERLGVASCFADANRLSQVVGNLVSNAITYGAADAPILVTTAGDGTSRIEVHNQGTPIPPALLPTLFEPMTRGGTGQFDKRSVGLGLYIVAEIARAHGGTATVTSTPDAGTTFRIELPAAIHRRREPEA